MLRAYYIRLKQTCLQHAHTQDALCCLAYGYVLQLRIFYLEGVSYFLFYLLLYIGYIGMQILQKLNGFASAVADDAKHQMLRSDITVLKS